MPKRTITKKNSRTVTGPGIGTGDPLERERTALEKKKKRRAQILQYLSLAAIAVFASFLLLSNLDNQYLWQDEAETALVGRTILSHGYPIATDGRNSFSQDIAGDEGKFEAWRLHPWLQFYIVAGSFALLGPSTFSARLPFALFGIAVIVAVFFFTRDLFKSGRIALIASGLLTISVPFLLLCRQCRYYSPLMFFSLMTLWMYFRFMQGKKNALPLLIIAATLCFHSFYPSFLLLPIVMTLHAALFHRERLRSLFVALAAIAVINFPWFLWFRAYPGVRRNVYHPVRIVEQLAGFGSDIAEFVFTPWLLGVLLAVAVIYFLKHGKIGVNIRPWWSPVVMLLTLVLTTIFVFSIPAHTYFRYLSPAIPVLCMISALIIYTAFRAKFLLGVFAIALAVLIQPLNGYYQELTNDYIGPMEGISKYLNAHAKPDDIVLITYGDMTLKFYTKLRILGGYTGENLDAAHNADWVIVRKHVNSPYEVPVRRFIAEKIDFSKYERITLDCPDLPFENRECPRLHRFSTARDEDRVVVYKRRVNGE